MILTQIVMIALLLLGAYKALLPKFSIFPVGIEDYFHRTAKTSDYSDGQIPAMIQDFSDGPIPAKIKDNALGHQIMPSATATAGGVIANFFIRIKELVFPLLNTHDSLVFPLEQNTSVTFNYNNVGMCVREQAWNPKELDVPLLTHYEETHYPLVVFENIILPVIKLNVTVKPSVTCHTNLEITKEFNLPSENFPLDISFHQYFNNNLIYWAILTVLVILWYHTNRDCGCKIENESAIEALVSENTDTEECLTVSVYIPTHHQLEIYDPKIPDNSLIPVLRVDTEICTDLDGWETIGCLSPQMKKGKPLANKFVFKIQSLQMKRISESLMEELAKEHKEVSFFFSCHKDFMYLTGPQNQVQEMVSKIQQEIKKSESNDQIQWEKITQLYEEKEREEKLIDSLKEDRGEQRRLNCLVGFELTDAEDTIFMCRVWPKYQRFILGRNRKTMKMVSREFSVKIELRAQNLITITGDQSCACKAYKHMQQLVNSEVPVE